MHIGLFGGSFDPPHICHLLFCAWALEMERIDKILWVPCAEHAFGKQVAPFDHRMEMSRLAAGILGSRVEVSDIERDLPRPSYTIRTVEEIRRRMPDDRISVLIGSDIMADVDDWKEIDDLRAMADFVVVPRGGYVEALGEVNVSLPRLSSSAVRDAIGEGKSVEGVLTPAVIEYIKRNGLYRD